jgi:hypothetical protein
MILAIVYRAMRWIAIRSKPLLLVVGLMWMILTLACEIGLGRFLFGLSWQRIAEDFNILQGGVLSFGFLILALSPIIAAKYRKDSV